MSQLPDEPNPREPLAFAAWTMAGVQASLELVRSILLSRLIAGDPPKPPPAKRRGLTPERTLGKDRSLDP